MTNDARCVYEIYQVTCKCGRQYLAMVKPQEIEAGVTGNGDKLETAAVKCPQCGNPATFLGCFARGITLKEIL